MCSVPSEIPPDVSHCCSGSALKFHFSPSTSLLNVLLMFGGFFTSFFRSQLLPPSYCHISVLKMTQGDRGLLVHTDHWSSESSQVTMVLRVTPRSSQFLLMTLVLTVLSSDYWSSLSPVLEDYRTLKFSCGHWSSKTPQMTLVRTISPEVMDVSPKACLGELGWGGQRCSACGWHTGWVGG